MRYIEESDWKHLRNLKSVALDRFCSRIFAEIERTSSDNEKTPHERYLTVYRLIQKRDRELGQMFNDLKRSNAMTKLFLMQKAGLLTDGEWGGFSDEIKNIFASIQNI